MDSSFVDRGVAEGGRDDADGGEGSQEVQAQMRWTGVWVRAGGGVGTE